MLRQGWSTIECCTGMFKGKPRAGNSQEIPISWEVGGKSLSIGNSRVTGIFCGLGNSHDMGNSRILEVITFSYGIQIAILKMHLKDCKILFESLQILCFKVMCVQCYVCLNSWPYRRDHLVTPPFSRKCISINTVKLRISLKMVGNIIRQAF